MVLVNATQCYQSPSSLDMSRQALRQLMPDFFPSTPALLDLFLLHANLLSFNEVHGKKSYQEFQGNKYLAKQTFVLFTITLYLFRLPVILAFLEVLFIGQKI